MIFLILRCRHPSWEIDVHLSTLCFAIDQRSARKTETKDPCDLVECLTCRIIESLSHRFERGGESLHFEDR